MPRSPIAGYDMTLWRRRWRREDLLSGLLPSSDKERGESLTDFPPDVIRHARKELALRWRRKRGVGVVTCCRTVVAGRRMVVMAHCQAVAGQSET